MTLGVSVCLPVRNGASILPKAIESVLGQTYPSLELLVWDDGSEDNGYDVARGYGARVFRSENIGVAMARNRMLGEAKFDLVAFIDHDDEWQPEKLELQVPRFKSEKIVLAHGNCRYEFHDRPAETREIAALPADDPFSHILPDNRIITSAVVCRKQALDQVGGFPDLRRCSDWRGWLDLASIGDFVYDPEVLVNYTVREDSLANAGLEFHRAQFEVLQSVLKGDDHQIFARLPREKRKRYRQLTRRSSGVALSSMSSCQWKQGVRGEARSLAFRALMRAPRVFRVWTRAWRAFTR